MIEETKGGTYVAGEIARGCSLCMQGAKMVLFVTGECKTGCYYCPISFKRRGKNNTWANERPVLNDADVLEETRRMNAKGASLTGGEPTLEMDRCIHYIKLLKEAFGQRFHIHLYTCEATPEQTNELAEAGLDEIRFHDPEKMLESMPLADKLDIGCEMPCIPGQAESLKRCIDKLAGKAKFINLNELEFSESNVDALNKRGFKIKHELSHAVAGSEELGRELLEYANGKIDIHFCTSRFKDAVQYRNRLKRTAKNIHKPYEKVTQDGLLLKGGLKMRGKATEKELAQLREKLIRKYSLSPDLLWVDKQKHRLETSVAIAKRLASDKEIRAEIIEEFPTWDRYEAETMPL